MAEIKIRLRDSVTEKQVEVELPDDVAVKNLLPEITRELGVKESIQHRLTNKTQGFEYNEDDTLASRGTKPDAECVLAYEIVQGAWMV